MNKKFLSYLPARLVKGYRWYIIFYQVDPKTDQRKRFIRTHDLNRIPSIEQRQKKANAILVYINERLPLGYPFVQAPEKEKQLYLSDAIAKANKLKTIKARARTVGMYLSVKNIFLQWSRTKNYDGMLLSKFTGAMAYEFMDYLLETRGVSERTYNNYTIRMKALFNALVEREYILKNPFGKVSKLKVKPKDRRELTGEEKKVISQHIRENDIWLYRMVLLLYVCLVRPNECRGLKFKMFDFQNGTILIPGSVAKNGIKKLVTMPKQIQHYFLNKQFCSYPANYYVFGFRGRPHPDKKVGNNTFYERHKKVLMQLHKDGSISSVQGLTLYSWKDTGVYDLSEKCSMLSVKQQAGWQDVNTVINYYNKEKAQPAIRDFRLEI